MSSLYTIGQMNELADAFEADGYTNEMLKALVSNGRLTAMKSVLYGEAKIVPIQKTERTIEETLIDSMIKVDRTIRPNYPNWMKRVMHPELEATGPAEFDTDSLEKWLHDDQKTGVVTGNTIYDHLKKNEMLESCLGLRDLEEIQKKGIAHFRRNFKDKYVFGWKSVVRSDGGSLRVPCLCEDGEGVVLLWRWLVSYWFSTGPALRFAK